MPVFVTELSISILKEIIAEVSDYIPKTRKTRGKIYVNAKHEIFLQ